MHEPSDDDAGERDRYVYIERPRCPKCDSLNLKSKRSTKQQDETIKRHTTCRDCQHSFFVIAE